MRKLASIQTIEALHPIEGAERIEAARVLGWTLVVAKGLNVGDRVVFCEIDSVLPKDKDWAQFTAKYSYRVKTQRLRGVLSQGLALPLSVLPERDEPYLIGDDVTELLGITKYDADAQREARRQGPSMGVIEAPYPLFLIPKTDEIRIQSALGCLQEMAGRDYYMTLKYDGSSATYLYHEDTFLVCSRNFIKKPEPPNLFWQVAHDYELHKKLKRLPELAIQGEICAPGLQKNRLGVDRPTFVVFNIWHLRRKTYLDYQELVYACNFLQLKMVEVIEAGHNFNFTLDELLTKAEGMYPGTTNEREGLVVRPQKEIYSKTLGTRLSFKVISNKYLLKE